MAIAPQMVTFGRAATAAAELLTLIDRKSDIDSLDHSGEKPEGLSGEIELQGISFSYPTRQDVTVLDNFSLRFPGGKVTALVVSLPPAFFLVVDQGLTLNHNPGPQRIWKKYYHWSSRALVRPDCRYHQAGR